MPMKLKTFAALASTLVFAFNLDAHAAGAQAISVQNAWVRWLPNDLPAAGFVPLANASDKPIDLVGVSSADYGEAMLHQTVSNGSTQKMVMAEKATVPPHGNPSIPPGGYHFMLRQG